MIKTPFIGAAYYPEVRDEEQVESDIRGMKETGITCVRIGEFAWHKMEPRPGEYDFSFFHRVIDKLAANDIAVIMGTPTACPPIWLSQMFPDVFALNENNVRSTHGARRNCCSNNPHYLEYCDKIVEAMAKEFADEKNIIAWQIDNEIYDRGCHCEYCTAFFHNRLREKYGTIENLNRRWCLELFSQAYESFEQVPNIGNAWHSPHLHFEWHNAQYEQHINFVHRQAAILKKYVSVPVGTDMMPKNGLDYEKTNSKLDLVMFNHYTEPDHIRSAAFWFSYLRTLKDTPFLVTETWATWNGSVAPSQVLKPEGTCRLNSSLPVAMGAEGNMYWLFRQHPAGHELNHGSVFSAQGNPCHTIGEIKQCADEFAVISDFVMKNPVKAQVAMHFTSLNRQLFAQQGIYSGNDYEKQLISVFSALTKQGVTVDVTGAKKDLSGYKVVFSPFMMSLEDGNLPENIRQFVKNGGVWVAGPLTDIRDGIGAHYQDKTFGIIEEMTGAKQLYYVPTDGSLLKAAFEDGCELPVEHYAQVLSGGGRSIAHITEGHSALNGKDIVSSYEYGKGRIIVCGAITDEKNFGKIAEIALSTANVERFNASENVICINRNDKGFVFAELDGEEGFAEIKETCENLLTNERISGKISIKPYDIIYLRKI